MSLFWVPACFTSFEHRIEQAQLVHIYHHWACGSGTPGALGPTKRAKSIKMSIFRHRAAHSKDVFFLGTPCNVIVKRVASAPMAVFIESILGNASTATRYL